MEFSHGHGTVQYYYNRISNVNFFGIIHGRVIPYKTFSVNTYGDFSDLNSDFVLSNCTVRYTMT